MVDRYPTAWKSEVARGLHGLSRAADVVSAEWARELRGLANVVDIIYDSVAPSKPEPATFSGRGGSFGGGGAGGEWAEDKGLGLGIAPYIGSALPDCIAGQQYYSRSFEYKSDPGRMVGTANNWDFGGSTNLHTPFPVTLYGGGGYDPATAFVNSHTNEAADLVTAVNSSGGLLASRSYFTGAIKHYAESFYLLNSPTSWDGTFSDCSVPVPTPRVKLGSGADRQPKKSFKDMVEPRGATPREPSDRTRRRELPRDLVIQIPVRAPVRAGAVAGGPPPATATTEPNSSKRVKVGKRTKEKKFSLRSKFGTAWLIVNAFTEVEDFVKALNQGLPKGLRAKPWQPDGSRTQARDMLEGIYKHFGSIDLELFINALVNNEVADWYYGLALGKTGKFINQTLRLPTGGNRIANATIGKVLPRPPKVNVQGKEWWLLIA